MTLRVKVFAAEKDGGAEVHLFNNYEAAISKQQELLDSGRYEVVDILQDGQFE